jgi:RHS repeat-associated protein
MATSSASFYFHHDPLNSTSDLTDATGTPQWAYSYEPYGATLTASNVSGSAPENRVRFTSQYADTQTSSYNLRARQYDPATGRFGALDPLGGSTTTPAVGSYVYADGQPTLLTDPLGLCAPLECFDQAFAIASKALGQPVHSLNDLVDVAFAQVKAEIAQAASDAAHAAGDAAHLAADSNLLRGVLGFQPTSGNGGAQYQLGAGIGLALMFFAPEIRAAELVAVLGREEATAGEFVRAAEGMRAVEGTRAAEGGELIHVDVGGEGDYPGAINVNPATEGKYGRIPNLVRGTAQSNPLPDAFADRVTAENIPLHHEGAVQGIARLVKPGGQVGVANPASFGPTSLAHQDLIDTLGGEASQVVDEEGILRTTIRVPR